MSITASAHFEFNDDIKVKVSEIVHKKCLDKEFDAVYIHLGTGDLTIGLNRQQADQLMEQLEGKLYEDFTYKELLEENRALRDKLEGYEKEVEQSRKNQDERDTLHAENEELKEEVKNHREYIQDMRRSRHVG